VSAALAERPLTLDDTLGPRWRDLAWRRDNHHWIVDEHGMAVPFRPNDEQRDFVANLHTRNIILKSRQAGLSKLMQVLDPNQALFNANHNGVVIAGTLPNAGKLFAKVEFATAGWPSRSSWPCRSRIRPARPAWSSSTARRSTSALPRAAAS
jgi:hypothetical protein